jgi:hypothetical protein
LRPAFPEIADMSARLLACVAVSALAAACTDPETPASPDAPAPSESTAADRPLTPSPETTAAIDAAWPAGSPAVTPAEVSAMLEADGAEATVDSLRTAGGDSRWSTALRGVAMGDGDWLGVVAPLSEGARDGAVDDLNEALSYALINNPTDLLGAYDTWSGHVQGVCQNNVERRTPEEVAAFYAAAIAAVEAVEDTAAGAGVCLSTLRGAQAG